MNKSTKDRIRFLLYLPFALRDCIYCIYSINYWKHSWRLRGLPLIQKHRKASINIGNGLVLCSIPQKNSIGVFQKVIIKALNPESRITIGNNVGISGATISGKNIKIGNNVLIGSGVLITDSDAHPIHPSLRQNAAYIKTKPIIIEDDVFIGARAIILKGVTIGHGTVIGAGSVVVNDLPPMSIACGNPAKVVNVIKDLNSYLNNYE